MTPEEFLRAALGAGAQVRYVDGEMTVTAGTEVTFSPPQVVAPHHQRAKSPADRTAGKNYRAFKEAFGDSNAGVLASALGVLIGVKTGRWTSEAEEILKHGARVDLPTLRGCVRTSVAYQHTISRRTKNPPSMSVSAVTAAMYAALDHDASLTLDQVIDKVNNSGAFRREINTLSLNKDELGGARSMAFRRDTYNRILAVLLDKEV